MRVAYITAGAAGMYCGSCIRDNTLAASMMRLGHDVALIPTYTPVRTDEADVSIDRVFYGAVNIYLEQKSALFQRLPRWLDHVLAHPRLLQWVSRLGSSTDARMLGRMTLSMLQGEQGNQREELHKLVDWLKSDYRPEIVQLTNSMFLGLAGYLQRELDVPVLCAVQGEDLFLEQLVEPYRTEVLDLLRQRARDANGFIATSRYYADYMTTLLDVPRDRMHHVALGLQLDDHGVQPPLADGEPFVVGYMARLCPEKGLHLLAEAFHLLAQRVGTQRVRLRVAGYVSPKDRGYVDGVQARLERWGLRDAVEFLGEVDRARKIELLGSIHVLSVPAVYREPKGLYVLEALANGVPVVEPRHGAFPELIEATNGGLLVDPDSPTALAEGLHTMMADSELRRAAGQQGRRVVHRHYGDGAMAEATLEVYRRYRGSDLDRSSRG